MKQNSFAAKGFALKPKQTRKEKFLQEMEEVVPWARLEALIEPHYPKAGKGRKPYRLSTMLRIYFMQQWFGYSDAGMEEALHDIVERFFTTLHQFHPGRSRQWCRCLYIEANQAGVRG